MIETVRIKAEPFGQSLQKFKQDYSLIQIKEDLAVQSQRLNQVESESKMLSTYHQVIPRSFLWGGRQNLHDSLSIQRLKIEEIQS